MIVFTRLAHRSQMDRHMRRICDQIGFDVEQRARKVEPFLDIHRIRRIGERNAHLLGDRHEEIVEDFEQHRIGRRADRVGAAWRRNPRHDQMVERGQVGAPSGSTTVVALRSAITAGPSIASPGRRSSRA
jgi:hypothetical protein